MADHFMFETIPFEIGMLTNLETLDLSRNLLTSLLPDSLGSLAWLLSFRLSENFLKGAIKSINDYGYPALSDSLVELDLSSNYFDGTLPREIWILSNLEIFNVSSNALMGAIPFRRSPDNHLATLDLSYNIFKGTILSDFGHLMSLTSLDLSSNDLDGPTSWELFSSMTMLKSLDLSDFNKIQAPFPTQILNLTNLEDLNLSSNLFFGSIPPELALLTNLKRLDLSTNSISGEIMLSLTMMPNLAYLDLYANLFTSLPSEIGLMTNIEYLDLGFNQFNGALPTEFGLMTNIEYLHLQFNSFAGSIPTEIGRLTA